VSPILDMQRSMTERGRIRLGYKATGTRKDGSTYTRPAKSDTFLISSKDRGLIDQAATEFGAQVVEFDAGYRFDTGQRALDVVIPPAYMAFSQWYELWGNKVCHRRCDGLRETISDGDCQCDPDPTKRECKTTTRLSVMLVDLPGFGLWRIESHGWYAATELFGGIEALAMLAPDTLVRGRLVADHREVVRFDADGKPKTHKFVVPTLDLPDVRLRELIAPDGGVGVAINAPSRPAGLTPVAPAALTETTGQSIAEQLATTAETPRRKNAAAVLPPTGLRPGQIEAGAAPREGSSSGGVPATAPEAARPEHAGTAEVVPQQIELGGEESSSGDRMPPSSPPTSEPVTLGDLLNRMEGKAAATRKGRLLKVATEIAKEHTWPAPETVDKIDQRLLDAIAAELPAADPRAKQRAWMHATWGLNGGNEVRKDAISVLTSGRTDSSSDLTEAEWREFMDVTGALPVQLPPREAVA
jgi:hypothetical protein